MEPEVGTTYDIEIEDEVTNEWTGPMGVAKMGGVAINVPKAKKGDKLKIKVTSVATNQWTGQKEAQFEKVG